MAGTMRQPLVIDLFCGLGGWSEPFIAEGYEAVGFDIEAHDYGSGGYPGKLVLRDIRSITGSDLVKTYGVPTCIVASPPCQEFSYMAMPWGLAKEKQCKILADPAEQKRLTELFNECFRIQREVNESAGRYVPMVVENVRGAQRWVGKARWNFGSFYLWGDVPALMPIPGKKSSGGKNMNISLTYSELKSVEGVKGFTPEGQPMGKNELARMCSSKSKRRKQASAEIAKIPYALGRWIAKCFLRDEKL
jgi:C-5 cytosine-specific DNA methylase